MLMPYVRFNGTCKDAFLRYAEIFNGEIQHLSMYGDIPENTEMPISEELKSKVMHGQLLLPKLGGISGADSISTVEKGGNVSIQAHLPNEETAQKIFSKLAEAGVVIGPLGTNPPPDDNSVSGCVEDMYGVTWIISATKIVSYY
ncbi:VOC family protein [Enterococcus sp. AZ196]|uniref:VOC family protein n=1 Tax=Enterococcus sp. AZ196 TaxID=2774659 RepID=UPI003D2A905A